MSLVYEVTHCYDCGKPIKSIPAWLSDVKVRFTCDTCRQKHPKALAGYETVGVVRPAPDEDLIDDPDLLAVVDDEVADDDVVDADVVIDEPIEEPIEEP